MTPAASNPPTDATAASARAIVRRWRRLTGGPSSSDTDRRTLLACSGGVDSSAMAIALSGAGKHFVIGHVVHDLRPAAQAEADSVAAGELAAALGLPLALSRVRVSHLPGNAEGHARTARYEALEQMASAHGCPFVATGHQADDQAETMLMAAARGAGLSGLSGIDPTRPLSRAVELVRPMLGLTRRDAWALCSSARWEPVCDETNSDPAQTRANLRLGSLGELLESMPSLAGKLGEAAAIVREADGLVRSLSERLWQHAERTENAITWPREAFVGESWLVIASHLRSAHSSLVMERGADRLSQRVVRPVAERLSEPAADGLTRSFAWRGVTVRVDPSEVRMIASDGSDRGQWRPGSI